MNPFSGHLIDLKEAALPAGYDKVPLALERIAAAELAGRQETHVDLSKPTPLAEWAKKKRLARPDEKEGLQGPAIEDRASQLRKFVEQVQAGKWKGAEARRVATMVLAYVDHGTGVEPRPQDRQEGAVSSSSEPSASGGAVQRAADGDRE